MAKKPTLKRKLKVPKTLDMLDELIKDAVAVSNRPDFDKLRAIAKGNKFKIPDVPGAPFVKVDVANAEEVDVRGVPEPKVATVEQLRIGFLEDERKRLTEEIKLTHEIYARILDRFLMD